MVQNSQTLSEEGSEHYKRPRTLCNRELLTWQQVPHLKKCSQSWQAGPALRLPTVPTLRGV